MEEARRRKVELEQGTNRAAEDEGEQPEATKLRIEMLEADELHEPDWMWDESDYDTVTGEALDPRLVKKGKEEEIYRFEEMRFYRYVT